MDLQLKWNFSNFFFKSKKKELEKTKVAVIGGRGYQSNYGGVENAIREIFSRIGNTEKFDVDVYGHSPNNFLSVKDVSENITSITVPRIINKIGGNAVVTLIATLYALLFRRPQVFIFFASGPCAMALITRLLGIHTIGCLRAIDSQRDKWGLASTSLLRLGEQSALKHTNICTVNSLEMQRIFKQLGHATQFIPNGFSYPDKGDNAVLKKLNLKENNYILFAARFDPVKRLHVLLEAYRKLPPEQRIPLVVAGGKCKSEEYRVLLDSLKSEGVIFVGHVKKDILDPLMRNCAIFVLPSVLEGMSNSLLSAMSAARCVVCADVPENSDVIEGDSRVLFEKDNVEELSKKLSSYISDFSSRNSIGKKMQYLARKNNRWESTASNYVALINKLTFNDYA